jgi:ABC-type transport system involved in cytochrome bd biosynthesis fused ATPase/permease subunit
MPPPLPASPYVGLRPFREEDSDFFFGREKDIRIISSNLLSEPLTVLYGPSGVGKSSVLQAGVVPELKAIPNT